VRWFSLLSALAAAGCATLPDNPVERALYSDLRQIVDTRQRIGWTVEVAEIEDAAPSALQSVCQVEEERRIHLLDWLDQRIADEGGPVEEAWENNGESLDGLGELMTLERMRLLLTRADERAGHDCPFYLKPDPEFAGVQTDTDRVILLAESFGALSLIVQDEEVLLGGGGSLRLLPGYGASDRVTLALGVELGASGAVSQTAEEQQLVARPSGAVPFIVRLHDDTWIYDLEVSLIARYADGSVTTPGIRVAPALGIGSVRIGALMPVALAVLAYEYYPAFEELPASHAVRLGTRIGLDYDP
jgi:hypothetical protein